MKHKLIYSVLFFLSLLSFHSAPLEAQTTRTFYVDCSAANAGNGSQITPWNDLTDVNAASFLPGDNIMLKRGCIWAGPLDAKWIGTASSPITFTAYGSGNLPVIKNAPSANVVISGDYQIIEYIQTTHDSAAYTHAPYVRELGDPYDEPGCMRLWGYKLGFIFQDSAQYNTVQYSRATNHSVGVYTSDLSSHNKVLHNYLYDNRSIHSAEPYSNPVGTMGVLLHGLDNEIAYNKFETTFTAPEGWCQLQENSIETFKAKRSLVHHNITFGDRVFSETGSWAAEGDPGISDANVFAYNLHVTDYKMARFLVIRETGTFGPVTNTKVYHNTVYFTAADSTGISCGGCENIGTIIRNNIITAKNGIYGTNVSSYSSNNVFNTALYVNATADSSTANFNIAATNPARNAGTATLPSELDISNFIDKDLDNVTVPAEGARDVGAYEFTGVITPTPRPQPPTVLLSNCADQVGTNTGSFVTIGWSNSVRPVTTIEISQTSNYQIKFTRSVSGLVQTTGPTGFTQSGSPTIPLSLLPNTTYFARVWDGTQNSASKVFTVADCSEDLDRNGVVEIIDAKGIIYNWLNRLTPPTDQNTDGNVNALDFAQFLTKIE